MQITKEIQEFITGFKFSNGEKIVNNNKYADVSRIEYLTNLCAGKNIIHVGCLDHLEIIDIKRAKGIWLHEILTQNSNECIGIDINEEGIKYIQEKYKINNIFFNDITKNPLVEITSKKWDYIILGEVLEHVDNPEIFLKTIKELYHGCIDKMIITAPNVLNLETFKYLKNNIEFINTDHRYWFSSYTLLKILYQTGISFPKITYCNRIPLTNFQLIIRKFKKIIFMKESLYPFTYFSTLLFECKI